VVDDPIPVDDRIAELLPLFSLGAGAMRADRDKDRYRVSWHACPLQLAQHRRRQQMIGAVPGCIGHRDADIAFPAGKLGERAAADRVGQRPIDSLPRIVGRIQRFRCHDRDRCPGGSGKLERGTAKWNGEDVGHQESCH
jgi:hypothetical protein